MKKHNFTAGPCILNDLVLKDAASACLNFAGTGLSVLEVSHRDKEFDAVMLEARNLFKELLDVPEGYEVLFLGGGASLQFYQVPLNLLKKKAAFINTGTWATNAIKQAKIMTQVYGGEVEVLASSEDKNFSYIPKDFVIPEDVDYFHFTTNNTIYGTEIRKDFDTKTRLVADMSSDIFSRPIDVSKYDLIYGGAQKNIGPAGATFVLVNGCARTSRLSFTRYAELSDPHQERLYVQHSSRIPRLCSTPDDEVVQRTRRCEGVGKDESGQGSPYLRCHRQQQDLPRHG